MKTLIVTILICAATSLTAQIEFKEMLFERPKWMGKVVAAADFDGNGETDYMFPNFIIFDESSLALHNYRIVWDEAYIFYEAISGDLDGDGDVDIFAEDSGTWYAMMNDGSAEFTLQYSGANNAAILGLTSPDSQGKVDVLLENFDEDNGIQYFYHAYLDQSSNEWKTDSISTTVECVGKPEKKAYHDYDQDGDKDILIVVDGKVHLLRETGDFEFVHEYLFDCEQGYNNIHVVTGIDNEVLGLALEGHFEDPELGSSYPKFEIRSIDVSGTWEYLLEPQVHFVGPKIFADISEDGIDDFAAINRDTGKLIWFISSPATAMQYTQVEQEVFSNVNAYPAATSRFLLVGDEVLYTDRFFWKYCYIHYEDSSIQEDCLAECEYPYFDKLTVQDINNDGNEDLVLQAWNKLMIMASDGSGQLSDPSPIFESDSYLEENWTLFDFDNNDSPDIMYSRRTDFVSGPFSYQFYYEIGITELSGGGYGPGTKILDPLFVDPAFFWADLNQDTYIDLMTRNHIALASHDTLRVFLNDQQGAFEPPLELSIDETQAYATYAKVIDWNMDGLNDYVFKKSGLPVELYYRASDENGIFADSSVFIMEGGSSPWPVVIDDWSGDGIPDLVVAEYAPSTVRFFKGNGDGGVTLFQELDMLPIPMGDQLPNELSLNPPADFDGDGHLDLLMGYNLFLWNGADESFVHHVLSDDFLGLKQHLVMDLNLNGKADIIAYDTNRIKHYEYTAPLPVEDKILPEIDLEFFPNPANSQIYIEISQLDCHSRLDIYDVYGSQVHSISLTESSSSQTLALNCELWASGLYFYSLRAVHTEYAVRGSFVLQ